MTDDNLPATAMVVPESITIAHGSTMAQAEKIMILETLGRLNGNRTRTALALGISIRTLRNKLKQYRREEA